MKNKKMMFILRMRLSKANKVISEIIRDKDELKLSANHVFRIGLVMDIINNICKAPRSLDMLAHDFHEIINSLEILKKDAMTNRDSLLQSSVGYAINILNGVGEHNDSFKLPMDE